MTAIAEKPLSPLVDSVTRNGFCTGCGLCESIAPMGSIQMRMSTEGYLRPVVLKELPTEATQHIAAACPGVKVEHLPGTQGQHPIWGPIVSVQTGHAMDPEVRRQGSSGGVISALAIHLLESGQVDFVAQIAVDPKDALRNALQISTSRADVLRAAGSRYAPSAPLQGLRELLDTGKRFAFIGKPCDVAALRQYGEQNPTVKRQIPFMLSFMCAGVPSIKGTHEVITALGATREKVVSFRYRGDGWPGMARAVHDSGESFEMDYNTSWGQILGKYLQFRCKICPDGTGEFADIVCADAWYGQDGYPDFTERDGRSLVLARTPNGQKLLSQTVNQSIITSPLDIKEIRKMQPYQDLRKKLVSGRSLAVYIALGETPKYINLGLWKSTAKINPIIWLRNAWGTYKRIKPEVQ
ncbi:MAG: Coenzyme F420 hydrogenase/dehydrogenase, beta subunit C-terminal domain [Rhodoferax sp.]|nr:Coenzyme F420 hydrogenase/dehydrogenase, beta subunit C-terminal domain [Rhodoferax sp.]